MDEDEQGEDGPDEEPDPATEARERSATTEGVRIAAVEAAVAAGLVPSSGRRLDARHDEGPGSAEEGSGSGVPLALPDWTDPPTGQVPRVLLGDEVTGDDDGARSPGPTWREDRADWDAEVDLSFLLGDDIALSGIAGRSRGDEAEDDLSDFSFADLATPEMPAHYRLPGEHRPSSLAGDEKLASTLLGRSAHSDADPEGLDLADDDEAWSQLLASEQSAAIPELEKLTSRREVRRGHARSARRHGRKRRAEAAVSRPASADAGRRAAPARRSPLLATATGVVAGAIALGCFAAGPVSSLVLVTLLVTVAAGEAFGALRRSGRRPATPLGLVLVPALVVGAYFRGPEAVPFVLGIGILVGFAGNLVARIRSDAPLEPVADLAATMLVVAWVGVLGSFAGLMLAPTTFPHRHGVAFLAAAVLLTIAADVGAYAVGARFGRHALAPRVSPHKSWEGLVGGVALVALVALLVVTRIHPLTTGDALLLGAVVIVLAPIGDLAESLVKRDLQVKDMGSLLPAHGGVLDRVDAMLFVLPVAYYVLRAVHPA